MYSGDILPTKYGGHRKQAFVKYFKNSPYYIYLNEGL